MRRYRYLIACALSWAAGVLCALALSSVADDEQTLRAAVAGWRDGTLLADQPAYAAIYAETDARRLVLRDVRRREGELWARYELEMRRGGVLEQQAGVVAFDVADDGRIVGVRHERAALAAADPALTGQMIDVATTAAGISSGLLVEANPLLAPLSGGPAGFVAMAALKAGAVSAADGLSYEACVEARQGLGTIGWGLGASNLGMLINPGVALVGAIVTAAVRYPGQHEDALVRCLPALGSIVIAEVGP